MKVAVIFINIGGYHGARLQSSCEAFSRLGWQLAAIQVTKDTLEHAWGDFSESLGVPVTTLLTQSLNGKSGKDSPFSKKAAQLLEAHLNTSRPDAILIPGWSFLVARTALKWSLKNRATAVVASESNEFDVQRWWWREMWKRFIVRKFSSALVGGQSHADYLVKLGFDRSKIAFGYDVVDNNFFNPNRNRFLSKPVSRPYFLGVSRFIPKKNIRLIIDSYVDYRNTASGELWDLVLCGDGILLPELKNYAAEKRVSEYIHFPGFLKQDQLLPYFSHAGCFVHASTEEQWGLVVNEAMAAGLPVIVSNRCGCFKDLVVEGENGFGFSPNDTKRLTQLLAVVSQNPLERDKMSQASLTLISQFDASRFGTGLVEAVELGLRS